MAALDGPPAPPLPRLRIRVFFLLNVSCSPSLQGPLPPPAAASPVSSSPSYTLTRPMMGRYPGSHSRSMDEMRPRSESDVST